MRQEEDEKQRRAIQRSDEGERRDEDFGDIDERFLSRSGPAENHPIHSADETQHCGREKRHQHEPHDQMTGAGEELEIFVGRDEESWNAPSTPPPADAEEDDADEIAGVVPGAVVGHGVDRDIVGEEREDEGPPGR